MSALPLIPVGDAAAPAKPKRRKPLATTTMTRDFYTARGYRVAFVERYVERPIPGTDRKFKVRFDAWGFADHLMFKPGELGMRAVNSCGMTGGDLAAHVTSILANPRAYEFLQDPNNRIGVMGWKRGARGKPATYKFRKITLEMYNGVKPPEPEKKPRKAKTDLVSAPEAQADPVKCRYCGVIKTPQVGWSLVADVCFVCRLTDNPPSATRMAKAEELNQGVVT